MQHHHQPYDRDHKLSHLQVNPHVAVESAFFPGSANATTVRSRFVVVIALSNVINDALCSTDSRHHTWTLVDVLDTKE